MLKNEREQEILASLRNAGYQTVSQLSRALYISESTVRRILQQLEKKGQVRRSYGGAELLDTHTHAPSFSARAYDHPEEKRIIAEKAASIVPDGSVLFLDQSSTAFYLAVELMQKHGITVMTNNVEILRLLSQTDFTVFATGGQLSCSNRMCLVDSETERAFRGLYADFAFFSTKSLSQEGIISDCCREEIAVRNAMLENAAKKVFLCHSGKFGTRSAYRQCGLADVDYLVTEENCPEAYARQFPNLTVL